MTDLNESHIAETQKLNDTNIYFSIYIWIGQDPFRMLGAQHSSQFLKTRNLYECLKEAETNFWRRQPCIDSYLKFCF